MKINNSKAAEMAEKRYGQNFLKDRRVLARIIEAMPEEEIPIAEIGPGLGDLTRELLKVRRVTAFEVDARLCSLLKEEFASHLESGRLSLECGDVRERWEKGKLLDEPYHLVANLPYYVATHLILRALKDPMCRSLTVMVQREVARKFAAKAGQREFSALSVLSNGCADVRLLFDVGPEAFVPPPKVTSSVLQMIKRDSLEDEKFERFLKQAFAQPRKKLLKNLAKHYGTAETTEAFAQTGLSQELRPHQVLTESYHRLYKTMTKERENERRETESDTGAGSQERA